MDSEPEPVPDELSAVAASAPPGEGAGVGAFVVGKQIPCVKTPSVHSDSGWYTGVGMGVGAGVRAEKGAEGSLWASEQLVPTLCRTTATSTGTETQESSVLGAPLQPGRAAKSPPGTTRFRSTQSTPAS